MFSLQTLFKSKRTAQNLNNDVELVLSNWVESDTLEGLSAIHQSKINIAFYNRPVNYLEAEINRLIQQQVTFDYTGGKLDVLAQLTEQLDLHESSLIVQDIQNLLNTFQGITNSKTFRVYLATINNNMCRRFHMDMNVLRMLCTYSGPGTLWLSEDNIDRNALNSYDANEAIVNDEKNIQQTATGAILVLKGAKYSKKSSNGAVHRSPTIEESGETRLLLRIDPA